MLTDNLLSDYCTILTDSRRANVLSSHLQKGVCWLISDRTVEASNQRNEAMIMGRGLSDLQKRVLIYTRDHVCSLSGYALWFDDTHRTLRANIGDAILPGKWGRWTDGDVV